MSKFVVNDNRTVKFVLKDTGLREDSAIHSSIGFEKDGELVAGVIFCDKTKTNIFMHVASKPGIRWVTRAYLKMVFGWCFEALKVKRITALVPESNKRAVRFDEHLGFVREAVLPDIFPDGGLVILKMTRAGCRFL